MMSEEEVKQEQKPTEKKGSFWQRFSFKKLNKKYVFMMSHDETLEPIVDFKVNLLRLSFLMLAIVIVLMVITAVVIVSSPIKEYLPGYTDQSTLDRELYDLSRRADSIERELQRKDVYFNNLKLVIEGYDFSQDSLEEYDIYAPLLGFNADSVELPHSGLDSALRAEFEENNLFRLNPTDNSVQNKHYKSANFFTPLVGTVVKTYDPSQGHYGVDIISAGSQVIKAVLDGTVVYASWTVDYGYTIGIQHEGNYLSNYKHNATLLKKEGDIVKAGEAIAIVGASGEHISEPELHFELWLNGMPMNPTEYINFEKEDKN